MVNKERLTNEFIEMCKIWSPALKERNIADYLKKELTSLGLEVSEDDAGSYYGGDTGNVIGILKAPGKKKVLFSAHMDTVTPCENIKPQIKDGVITSDGTTILGADDRAGIVEIMEMLRVIRDNNLDHPEIIVLFTICEEIGLLGAQYFDIKKYNPDYSFFLDGSGVGSIITNGPFYARGYGKIIGKSAHAGGCPEKGINALTVLAHAITKMRLGRIDEETTANIGYGHGGEASNTVIEEFEFEYEARSLNKDKFNKIIEETFKILNDTATEYGAKFENNIKIMFPGYEVNDEMEIFNLYRNSCKNVGINYSTIKTCGGTDASMFIKSGAIALSIGSGSGGKAHTLEESVEINSMVKCTEILLDLIKNI